MPDFRSLGLYSFSFNYQAIAKSLPEFRITALIAVIPPIAPLSPATAATIDQRVEPPETKSIISPAVACLIPSLVANHAKDEFTVPISVVT